MNIKKTLILSIISLILLISTTNAGKCAEDFSDSKSFGLFLVPQYFFINGFRLDLEKRISNTTNALVISPQVYSGRITELLQESNDKVKGAGLTLQYKHYMKTINLSEENTTILFEQSYIAGALGYNFFNINYTDQEFVEVGNEIKIQNVEKNLNIHRYNLGVLFGMVYQTEIGLAFDIYLGSGIQFSDISQAEYTQRRNYNEGMINYGYEGVTFLIGIKIGSFFN